MIATATFTTGDATTGPTRSDYYDNAADADYYIIVCEPVVYETEPIKFLEEPLPPGTITPRHIHTQAKNLLQTQNIKTNVRTRINNGRTK